MYQDLTLKWLHFGDIHFGNNSRDDFSIPLVNFLEHLKDLPDLVFITGDIADKGKKEEFRKASDFLDKLIKMGFKKEQFFVIPGNHDVEWHTCNSTDRLTSEMIKNMTEEKLDAFYAPFENYDDWVSDYFSKDFIFNRKHKYYYQKFPKKEFNVTITAFNTCLNSHLAESNPLHLEHGSAVIGRTVIDDLMKEIADRKDNEVRIVLGHHPLESLLETEAYEGVQQDIRNYFDFYLRGHQHLQAIDPFEKNADIDGYTPFLSIATGALQQEGDRIYPNSINMVDISFDNRNLRVNTTICPYMPKPSPGKLTSNSPESYLLRKLNRTNSEEPKPLQPLYTISIDEQETEIDKFSQLQHALKHPNTPIGEKFLYWDPSAAKTWAEICSSNVYRLHQSMLTSIDRPDTGINKMIESIKDKGKIFDFVNLGVGGGQADRSIISKLVEILPKNKQMHYIPVDQSLSMLQYAVKMASEFDNRKVKSTPILADFLQLERFKDSICSLAINQKIYGFLGGTIGNFKESEVLTPILKTMNENDYIIIGVGLIKNKKAPANLQEEYSIPQIKKFMFNPLFNAITSLDMYNLQENLNFEHRMKMINSLNSNGVNVKIIYNRSDVRNAQTIQVNVSPCNQWQEYFISTRYELKTFKDFIENFIVEEGTSTFKLKLIGEESKATDNESASLLLQKIRN